MDLMVYQDRKPTIKLRDALVCAMTRHLAFFAEREIFGSSTDFLDHVPADVRSDCDPVFPRFTRPNKSSDNEDEDFPDEDVEISAKALSRRLAGAYRDLMDGEVPAIVTFRNGRADGSPAYVLG